MKTIGKFLMVAGLLAGLAVAWVAMSFSRKSSAQFKRPDFSIHEDVAKADVGLGKRIFTVRNGCVDCHGEDLAGAKIMEDPAMGSIHGANITPYRLQDWTDEEIAAAIRYGIGKHGRSLRFMPSFDYEGLSKSDVAAVIAYLRSVPPVERESHANSFGPVARVLSVLGQMPVMFPAHSMDVAKGFGEKPPEAATPEFGKYLAGTCMGCHGPEYRGGKIAGGDPSWPEAPSLRMGDGFWNEAKFREVLASGVSAKSGQPLRPPMPVALLKQLNETETSALWLYLSSLN